MSALPLDASGPVASAVSAVLLGAGFGVALERAGLGDARKLTGQFYGTDFAVFKVMFTAIVVAAVGLAGLEALGVVDAARVYVAPTWLVPQVAGGLVFGVGFVMGGYCPGTGCTAAATGRLDGVALIGGMLAGTFLFGEALPYLGRLYGATPLGTLAIPALLGAPPLAVASGVAVLAVLAFVTLERLTTAP